MNIMSSVNKQTYSRMKIIHFIFFLIVLLVGATMLTVNSCTSDEDEPLKEPPTLTIVMQNGNEASSELVVSSEKNSLGLYLYSNSTWKVSKKGDDTDWLTVTPS